MSHMSAKGDWFLEEQQSNVVFTRETVLSTRDPLVWVNPSHKNCLAVTLGVCQPYKDSSACWVPAKIREGILCNNYVLAKHTRLNG